MEKIRLASFLLRLHPYFPDWRLLNWDSIKECMLEDDFMAAGGEESGDILSHLVGTSCYADTIKSNCEFLVVAWRR